jgi:hypothetical protein
MLTQERLKELLDYDPETGVFVWRVSRQRNKIKAGTPAGALCNKGYRRIQILGKQYLAHRIAWLYVHGCWPKKQIDHIDRVKDNNGIINLRDVSAEENGWNHPKHKDNTSGYTGVHWHKRNKKWEAKIRQAGKRIYLGSFDTPEEAHTAYLAAKEELHNIGDQQ